MFNLALPAGDEKRLRVLHVIPAIALRYGGPSQAIFTTCRALQSKGVEVLIATTNADGEGELPVPLEKAADYQGVSTIFFPRQWNEGLKYSRPLAQWMNRNIKNFDVTHIHAVFSHSSVAAAGSCRRRDIPYLVRPLGTLDPWSLKQKNFRKRLFWRFGVKEMLVRASAIHYTTDEERRLAEEELGLSRGVVIPNGIDLDPIASNVDISDQFRLDGQQKPYVLALSRIHPKKGFELLIESFASLKRQDRFTKWRLVIAGNGEPDYVDHLKTLVREKGLNGDAHFVGWLDGDRKYSAIRNASLVAMPSYQENFGISLVEAMAHGVPVLVSAAVNLAPEIENAGAGWVAAMGQEPLTLALEEALTSQLELRRRGDNGRQLASNYGSGEIASRLIELYRGLKPAGA